MEKWHKLTDKDLYSFTFDPNNKSSLVAFINLDSYKSINGEVTWFLITAIKTTKVNQPTLLI